MWEFLIKIGLTIVIVAPAGATLHWIWTHQLDPNATLSRWFRGAVEPSWLATRDPNKLYQGGQPVADIKGTVEEDGRRVIFSRLVNTAIDPSQHIEYGRRKLRVMYAGHIIGQEMIMGDDNSETFFNVRHGLVCEVVE